MLIIISPAKTLDFSSIKTLNNASFPTFTKEANMLAQILKKQKAHDLEKLMGISPKLAQLNFERYQIWKKEPSLEILKPAVFAFKGDVYQGLDIDSFTHEELAFANNHLRILSGLYGLLYPLDLVQAYRLEMGTKLKNRRGNSLYDFWGNSITKELNRQIKEQNISTLINLASKEYFKAIDFKKLKAQIITPNFKELRNGKLQFLSFNAKKARGMLSRYILQNQIQNPEDIKLFDAEGYYFDADNSDNQNWLFVR